MVPGVVEFPPQFRHESAGLFLGFHAPQDGDEPGPLHLELMPEARAGCQCGVARGPALINLHPPHSKGGRRVRLMAC